MNDPLNHAHPEELLGAYALDALEEDEALLVEAHLEVCPQCQDSVAQLQETSALLGLSAEQQTPPEHLQSQIMDSLPAEGLALSTRPASGSPRLNRANWLLPLAAAIVLGLFSTSLVLNLKVSGRVDQLQQQNSTVTAQLGQTMAQTQQLEQENSVLAARINQTQAQDEQILDSVNQIQAASYLAAHPDTQPLVLEPPGGAGNSQGVLLVGDRGQRALLMVSNMEQTPPLRSYQVWLVRSGHRMPVGQVKVDSSGWGSLALVPPEPLFEFDWINLTVEDQDSFAIVREKMVLRSRIPSDGSLR